ncbi:MAG: response regulator [Magnetococcus sp. DMHC-1]
MPTSFTFRVLVVEDDPEFRSYMQKAMERIQKSVNFEIETQYAITKEDAIKFLKEKHYHLVSLDQRFPEKNGNEIVHDTGLTLLKDIAEKYPTSSRLLYTAYPKIPYANLAGALDSTPYFGKSTDESDHPDEQQLTVKSWANKVQELLEGFVLFTLPRMGRCLPYGMALHARRMAQEFENHEKFMVSAKDLWESCLHLIWAQTLAIVTRIPNSPQLGNTRGNLSEIEKELKKHLPHMAEAGWLDPWLPYLGTDHTGSRISAGQRFLEQSSKLWRLFRNDKAHTFSCDDWEKRRLETHEPLFHLLDALSHWTVHPLFTRPTFDPTLRHAVRKFMVQGESLPWKDKTMQAPPGLNRLDARDSTHLFTLWQAPGVGEFLLDLHPYIQLLTEGVNQTSWVLSHFQNGMNGGWKFRSLASGEFKTLPLTRSDQNCTGSA